MILNVGQLRALIADLPDTASIRPDYDEPPGENDPQIILRTITRGYDESGPYLSLGLAVKYLNHDDDESKYCDECGEEFPEDEGPITGPFHKEECSLYSPSDTVQL